MDLIFSNGLVMDHVGQIRSNDLPKWAKDEHLYNCETSIKRLIRKKNHLKKGSTR